MNYNLTEMFGIKDTVSIVTGGAGGLGLETASALGQLGSKIAIIDLNEDMLKKAASELEASGIEVLPIVCDITSKQSIESCIAEVCDKWGRIDNLINCAGVAHLEPAETFAEKRWDFVINVNLKGTFLMCQQAGKVMLQQKKGRIVNFSSVRGFQGRACDMAYSPSKGAVNMLTKSLAIEWAEQNICVNAVAPTFTATQINKDILDDKEAYEKIISRIPMKRLAELQDIASSVAFLCSPCSEFITGQILYIDGGWTAA
jgi:2-deoxy-D-gluconate 3-dehydrogenase